MPHHRASLPAFTRGLKAHILAGDFTAGPRSSHAYYQQMLDASYRDAFSSHSGTALLLSEYYAVTASVYCGD